MAETKTKLVGDLYALASFSEPEAAASISAGAALLAEAREALRFAVTDPGALALRSHGFALQRLDAITNEVKAVLAKMGES